MNVRRVVGIVLVVATAQVASAADIPIVPKKLIVVDKLVANTAKVVFVAKDAAVTKGAGTDVEQVSVQFDFAYGNGATAGAFAIPAGTTAGWKVNKDTVAKYVNKEAPAGPTLVKVAVVKPGKLLKLVSKSLGDPATVIDIVGAGDPAGAVFTAYCVDNAGEANCHCSEFTGCAWKVIAGGTGAKLVCKTGGGDGDCTASTPPTTTTTTLPCGPVDLGLTVLDTCTDLVWEKKTTGVGSGVNAGDLNDVDNVYSWAGVCSGDFNAYCQPNPAAATTCSTQTGGAVGCAVCGPGQGACDVDWLVQGALTTVWDWLNQLNAAGFAGFPDWRLATSTGGVIAPTGDAAELETIIDLTQGLCGGGAGACIDPAFGPTVDGPYWSASTESSSTQNAAYVWFNSGSISSIGKAHARYIRAVRDNVAVPSTTSTTTTTSTSTTTSTVNPCFTDNGLTVLDTCNGLEWEKKNGDDGISNPANLNDVDNRHPWVGRCSGPNPDPQFNAWCQPDAAAETTCLAQTGGSPDCAQCAPADGPCQTPFGTTIFQWVNALNAATFAGASDWRIPVTTNPELSFILDLGQSGCDAGGVCIAPVFGPTLPERYWGANSSGSGIGSGRAVDFGTGSSISGLNKPFPLRVRAVRTSP